jgi:hypothetical protein
MSTDTVLSSHNSSRLSAAIVAVAALAAAVGVLAVGALLPGSGNGDHPSDGRVHPGKVSVLGRAKVRTWAGQTFSVHIPLKWQKVLENPTTHTYAWAQPASGASLSSSDSIKQAAGDWPKAEQLVQTRIGIQVEPSSAGRDAKVAATAFSRSSARYTDGFLDLGPVTIGPVAWRFDVAVAGTIESHYFFSTCADGRRRESWHLTVDRSRLHGRDAALQSQAINSIFASLKTVFPAARSSGPDCAVD